MKKIDFTQATVSAEQPLRSDSMDFLENGNIEVFNTLVLERLGNNYSANTAVILYGCVNSGSYPVYNITAGAIYFNGVVYLVPAFTGGSGSNVAICDLVTTQPGFATGGTQFTDGSIKFVHNDTKAIITAGTGSRPVTGTVLPDYSTWAVVKVKYSASPKTSITINSAYNSGILLDTPFTFTTPNDGVTRNYDIIFTCSAITLASATQEIQILVDGTEVGDGKSANLTAVSLEQCISVSAFGIPVPPNKVIAVFAFRGTADSTCRYPSFSIREIK